MIEKPAKRSRIDNPTKMDLNKQKEQFSIAYVRAVVAAAGYNV